MKGKILDNKYKERLLMVLCQHPNRFFSVKELALRTGMGQSRIKSLLQFFFRNDLLEMAEKKRQRYFQINRFSPVYQELVKIFEFSKHQKRGRDLLERIVRSAGDIKFAALSGIFVGLPQAEADLLLVGKVGPKRLKKCLRDLERLMLNEINYAVMSEDEFMERRYSFDWFIKEILENDPVIVVDTLGKKRKTSRRGRR